MTNPPRFKLLPIFETGHLILREGIGRQAYSLRGPHEDLLCYSILATEWRDQHR